GSPPIYSFYTPRFITNHSSHRQSSFHPLSLPPSTNTVHPCLAKAAKPPAPLPTHRPPPLDPLRRLLLRLLLPADRELQYLCPRTGCNTNLFLKGNFRKDRADYPACRNVS
ncbi:unnamed protein product, partial [Ectocarpus sp. 4 AP-2014]